MKKITSCILILLSVATFAQPGNLDLSFNSTGKVTTSLFSDTFDRAFAVAVQSDGKIVVAGSTDNGNSTKIAVLRYNPNGTLDNTFNGTGMVSTSNGGVYDFANALAIQPDGKILVTGES